MAEIPNLAGVATKNLVETIGGGKFAASYINWSRTMHLLREHAPGWHVDAVPAAHSADGDESGGILHRAPVGGVLLMRFRHVDGTLTPAVPQAVMDHKNNAIPWGKITARDITDTHRRGACMAAAMTFGLAYELWAKMPLESGYRPAKDDPPALGTSHDGPAPKVGRAAKARAKAQAAASPEETGADFAIGYTQALDSVPNEAGLADLVKMHKEKVNGLTPARREVLSVYETYTAARLKGEAQTWLDAADRPSLVAVNKVRRLQGKPLVEVDA